MDGEVAAHERVEAAHVFVEHGVAGGAELLERRVDVDGIATRRGAERDVRPPLAGRREPGPSHGPRGR